MSFRLRTIGSAVVLTVGTLVAYGADVELPTPKDCAEGRPNAIGWWSPIENGPMFTGPFLQAMVRRAKRTGMGEDVARCRRLAEGLLLCAYGCRFD